MTNADLKARYPRIDDPTEAISFALDHPAIRTETAAYDFLSTWREGAWEEIQAAYPEFLRWVDQ
jgi:hypothetical protein